MKLMVAGCSFSAPAQKHPGTSWSEIMAAKLGWDLENLARQGCSNGGVRIQIEEIRRQRPDFAVITPTFWDRMEIPARAAPYDWSTPASGWDPPLQRHLQKRDNQHGYSRAAGIDNVNYGNNDYHMICETIFSLAENYPHPYRSGQIDKTTQTAIRYYIDSIYDSEWKRQQDEWIIVGGILEMFLDGLKFLVVPNLLWPWQPEDTGLWRRSLPATIPNHFIALDVDQSVLGVAGNNPFTGEDPGYHSSARGQEIIAENWLERMHRDFAI